MPAEALCIDDLLRTLRQQQRGLGHASNRYSWLMKSLRCCELTIAEDLSLVNANYLVSEPEQRPMRGKCTDLFEAEQVVPLIEGLSRLWRHGGRCAEEAGEDGWRQCFPEASPGLGGLNEWFAVPETSWSYDGRSGKVMSRGEGEQYLVSPQEWIGAEDDFRIEYWTLAQERVQDLSLVVGGNKRQASLFHSGRRPEDEGYCFAFGAFDNMSTELQRRFLRVAGSEAKAEPGQAHHCLAERIHNRLRFQIDGRLVYEYQDPLPLGGPGWGFVLLYTFGPRNHFWDVTVRTRPGHFSDEERRLQESCRNPVLRTRDARPRFLEAYLRLAQRGSDGRLFFHFLCKDSTALILEQQRSEQGRLVQLGLERDRAKLEGEVSRRAESLRLANLRLQQEISERQQLESQLLHAQKMESIGRLAGGIAHDFNNILMVILGRCELLSRRNPDSGPDRRDLDEIRKSAERAAELTRQLLAFSRKQLTQLRPVDPNALVQDLREMLGTLLGERIAIHLELQPGLPPVLADQAQLDQVLMNLALNARDAMPEGGNLTIRTSAVTLENPEAAERAGLPQGSYLLLTVSDNGQGMDQRTLERIFEPFFTTKPVGQGTGLGLSCVFGIIKQHKGNILVSSEPGTGTCFRIYLPQLDSAGHSAKAESWASGPAGSFRGTVLVVEDEDAVRELIGSILEEQGYQVLAAEGSERALALCAQRQDPINLLICDVVIPAMEAGALARKILEQRPLTQVLYISGYSGRAVLRGHALPPGAAFLQKPFGREQLIGKVAELMNRL